MTSHRHTDRPDLLRTALFLLLLLIAPASTAHATRVRPLNIEEMTGRASRIVFGRCIEVHSEHHAKVGRAVTVVSVEVERALKGDPSRRLVFRQVVGGEAASADAAGVAGMPVFRVGEEVILFLAGESSAGLSTTLGLGQGKFSVVRDKRGERLAVNEFGNRALFRGLSPAAATRLADLPGRPDGRGGIPVEMLLGMVQALIH